MNNKKSLFQKNVIYFQYAKSFEEINPKMSLQIKNFGIQNIFRVYQLNKSVLSEGEKVEFAKNIQEMKTIKDKLGDNSNCTKEEFVDFLSNLFKNVDDVDREGEITMKTAGSFRLIGDLIEILSAFGTIDEDWNKKKKYCKYKCVDIVKSLKAGLEPKRGGPKENQDDDLINELNTLDKENKNEAVNSEINQNVVINKNQQNTNNLPNNNYQQTNDYNNQTFGRTPQNDNNYSLNHSNTNYPNNNQFQQSNNDNNLNQPNYNKININPNINIQNNRMNIPESSKQSTNQSTNRFDDEYCEKRNNPLSNSVISNHSTLIQKHENDDIKDLFAGIKIKNDININTKTNNPPNMEEFKQGREINSSMPRVNPIVTNLIKPPNIRLPTSKDNKADYDKCVKTILQHIEYASSELDYQKVNYSIDHIEMALYYLRNINI